MKTLGSGVVLFLVTVLRAGAWAQGGGASLAFETASVKPAAADAAQSGTGFMIGLQKEMPPHGLVRMTSQLAPLIMFAYGVEDEVEARAMRAKLPAWAQREKFTIVVRAPMDAPTQEELRGMVRGLLEERFAVKAHRATHEGAVEELSVMKPGVVGPGLKAHDAAEVCVQRGVPHSGPSPVVFCGLD